ncbi:MAG TPA: class I SAM-dependent methyltransferase [Pseudonocardiaceae bacterium]|jgi:SAM-dependent methyltransferase|nr:class I SAM-dependent methyltransferase [Pseudonocardiaceae bacterium]
MLARDLHEDNRRSWNSATKAHNSHKGDQAAFLRGGGTTLFPEELELLGDLSGRRLVHMQCNAGQDTLSLAALGADVTGVDISDEAVDFATRLSADSGIPGTFVRSDVFDWFDQARAARDRYDVVFCSYGAIGWLSDLTGWGQGIADALRPGGAFVTVEFHPAGLMFDATNEALYDYWSEGGPPETSPEGVGDYVARSGDGLVPWGYEEGMSEVPDPTPCHMFDWGLSEIIGALLGAGLRLEVFREYPWSNGCRFYPEMEELPGRRYVRPAGTRKAPLMYGIRAVKPEA